MSRRNERYGDSGFAKTPLSGSCHRPVPDNRSRRNSTWCSRHGRWTVLVHPRPARIANFLVERVVPVGKNRYSLSQCFYYLQQSRGECGKLGRGYDERRHDVYQFPERPYPNAPLDELFLYGSHIDRFFHFDDSDSTQYSYVGNLGQCRRRTQLPF